jgi:hypothetical protein
MILRHSLSTHSRRQPLTGDVRCGISRAVLPTQPLEPLSQLKPSLISSITGTNPFHMLSARIRECASASPRSHSRPSSNVNAKWHAEFWFLSRLSLCLTDAPSLETPRLSSTCAYYQLLPRHHPSLLSRRNCLLRRRMLHPCLVDNQAA